MPVQTSVKPPAKILFLAANPATTPQLALDEEIRAIEEKLRGAELRDAFALVSRWATRPDDLLQALNEVRPTIVHFSGHGTSGGLVLSSGTGTHQKVAPEAVASLFQALRDDIRIVVFNACNSLAQAEAAAHAIDCVVGMGAEIGDEAAQVFAASFYRALGFGRSAQAAFDQGLVALKLAGIPEDLTPRLLTRAGVSAAELFPLAPTPSVAATASATTPVEGASGTATSVAAPAVAATSVTPPSEATPSIPPRIALVAARADAAWLKRVQMHLKPVARRAGVQIWDSSMVPPGTRVRDAIAAGFAGSQVVVVLVTPELLVDDEFIDARLGELLAGAESDRLRLLSLIVSSCGFEDTELRDYQPLNAPDEPLDALSPADLNKRMALIAPQIVASVART